MNNEIEIILLTCLICCATLVNWWILPINLSLCAALLRYDRQIDFSQQANQISRFWPSLPPQPKATPGGEMSLVISRDVSMRPDSIKSENLKSSQTIWLLTAHWGRTARSTFRFLQRRRNAAWSERALSQQTPAMNFNDVLSGVKKPTWRFRPRAQSKGVVFGKLPVRCQ